MRQFLITILLACIALHGVSAKFDQGDLVCTCEVRCCKYGWIDNRYPRQALHIVKRSLFKRHKRCCGCIPPESNPRICGASS